MLDALRRGAQTWLAKILFAILIVSFGVFWNVGDVFRGAGQGVVAKVGETEITGPQFQNAFQNQIRAVSQEAGERITTEQALLFGFDRQALDRLVAQAAVKSHAEKLDLALSTAAVSEGVRNDPDFAGPDGKFSRGDFDSFLRQLDMSEQGFLALRRDDDLRRQVTDAIRDAIVVPKQAIDELHGFRNETRVVEFATIDPKKVGTIADPDDTKLRETYEAAKNRFMTPEYRKAGVLMLSADELAKAAEVSDADVRKSYDDTKASYDVPERRRIQQISFKDRAAAVEAQKAIKDGTKNFLDVAKEIGAKEADVNLGLLTKATMIDKGIADAAFKLARDELSDVIDGRFSYVIVRSVEVQPGKESTFDEVKDEVRRKLARTKAMASIQDRFDLVEEGRHAGKTLKEIGAEQKLPFVEVDTDKANKTPDGKDAVTHPDAASLIKAIFASSVGVEAEAVELEGDTFAWFDVSAITPETAKPFESVKDEVKKVYVERETARLVSELASKLAERLRGGEALEAVATDAGGTGETTEPIKRSLSPPGLTTEAMREIFALPKGAAGSAPTADGASRTVFRVKDVTPAPAATKEEADRLKTELKRNLENEVLLAYVAALRAQQGVSVNQTELNRVTGAESGQSDQ